ncbi:SnoaL-like domain-containing protein [Sphingomonas sp. CL5.1]|uniref:nuclear transport factor 2 family protein n=1 Tax=Sphingomonas sp. CL5.1 TaxID=2653203 RepID=UPI001581CCE2|nr:nuclear transport factor 2 family protein [Sphingomonas sp. CL5.1]QKR99901.1 SnoaL-like domain-containing protein [Sphingomonas sp. CL5.1]
MNYRDSAHIVVTDLFKALDDLTRGDTEAWGRLFMVDGVLEFPFAPDGYPRRVEGQKAIAQYLAGFPERLVFTAIHKDGVYSSENGLIVEFHVDGHEIGTDAPYPQRYIAVIFHEDGKIRHYRDYWNPLIAFGAMGGAAGFHEFGMKQTSDPAVGR